MSRIPRRPAVLVPALIPVVAFALSGCTAAAGPQVEMEHSDRLEALLPPADAYPEGYEVDTPPLDEVEQQESTGASFDEVRPTACGEALQERPEQAPEGAAEGAFQIAEPDSSDGGTFYIYALAEGDFSEHDVDTAPIQRVIYDCSTFTAYLEGEEMTGTTSELSSDGLPEGTDGFTMKLSGAGMQMTTRAAWGEVSGVYYALVALTLAEDSPRVSPGGSSFECIDEARGEEGRTDYDALTACTERQEQEAAVEANQQALEEFERILQAGVENLEDGA
ncbi:hypothetical protein ACFQXA_26590 [Nocardiopsis composta]